jgi:hypothetical protein
MSRQQLQQNQINVIAGGGTSINTGNAYAYETIIVDTTMHNNGIINFSTIQYTTSNAERGKHLEIYVDGLRKLPTIAGYVGDYTEQVSAPLIENASYITFANPVTALPIGAKVVGVVGGVEVWTKPLNNEIWIAPASAAPGFTYALTGMTYMTGGGAASGLAGRGMEVFCNGIRLYHGYEYIDQPATGLVSHATSAIFNMAIASGSVFLFQTAMPGASGESGTNGTNGTNGATGPVGPQGPQGAQGPAGQSSPLDGTSVGTYQQQVLSWNNIGGKPAPAAGWQVRGAEYDILVSVYGYIASYTTLRLIQRVY